MAESNPYELKKDCVVLACSGPSLNKIDPFSLGYPVVAISTAIRSEVFLERKPDVWILADRLNDMHGSEGKKLWRDPDILKVMPELRRKDLDRLKDLKPEELQQWYFCGYDNNSANKRRKKREDKEIFNGKMPFWRGPHKSVTFGLQWCHFMGVKTIIWVGCDLTANNINDKYAYKIDGRDRRKSGGYLRTLNVVEKHLRKWHPIAQQHNFEWYNWKCGEVLGDIIPPFIGKGSSKKIVVSIPVPPDQKSQMKMPPKRKKPVRELPRQSNRRLRRSQRKPKKIESVKITERQQYFIDNNPNKQKDLYDKYGRHISEASPENIDYKNINENEFLLTAVNAPIEELELDPINIVYVENPRERKRKEKEIYQKIKLRNMKRVQTSN